MMASLKQFHLRPDVSSASAANYGAEFFGLKLAGECRPKELCSYDDRNFLLIGKLPQDQEDKSYVLKVMNSRDSYDAGFIDAMDAAMIHFCQNNKEFACPIPVKSLSGQLRDSIELPIVDPMKCFGAYYIGDEELTVGKIKEIAKADPLVRTEERPDGSTQFYMVHYIRLLTFVPGKPLGDLQHIDSDLLWNCGVLVAKVQKTLEGFKMPTSLRKHCLWRLENFPLLENRYLALVSDPGNRSLAKKVINEFKELRGWKKFQCQALHNDINESNIICRTLIDSNDGRLRFPECNESTGQVDKVAPTNVVHGIIDFGELNYSYRVFEIAVCIAYMTIFCYWDVHGTVKSVYGGFESLIHLDPAEIEAIPTLVKARITQSLVIGNYQYFHNPSNDYLLTTSKTGWKVLAQIDSIPHEQFLTDLLNLGSHHGQKCGSCSKCAALRNEKHLAQDFVP